MKLKKLVIVSGTMTAVEGIHIGGNNEGTKVGGCDNPVIRNPLTGKPYIPGSSIKGVMRSTMEKIEDKSRNGKPCGCGDPKCMVCKLFGAHMNMRANSGEPRLLIRDMEIDPDFEQELLDSGANYSDIIEIKTSTMVDRSTNTAASGSLRNVERVAAGTKFKCEFAFKVFEGDNEKAMMDAVKNVIGAIEVLGIGSKTTAGCGQVKFDIDWDKVKTVNL